jgi:hypothetical protein
MSIEIKTIASKVELDKRNMFLELYENSPIPKNEKLTNSGLFVKRQDLTMYYHTLVVIHFKHRRRGDLLNSSRLILHQ